MLRLTHLTLDGVGPLRDIDIDFDALGSGLVAVVGKTGSGKTTLLDCSGPGVLRKMPYYGESPFDHMKGAGFMETTFALNGGATKFTLKQSKRGKQEAFVTVDGQKPIGPGKTAYDTKAAELLPDWDYWLATAYATQGGIGSIFRLSRALRYALFQQFLRLDRWQTRALAARSRQAAGRKQLPALEEAVQTWQAKVDERIRQKAELADHERKLRSSESDGETLAAAVKAAQSAADDVSARYAAAKAEKQQIQSQRDKEQAELDKLIVRIATLEPPVLDELEESAEAQDSTQDEAGLQKTIEALQAQRNARSIHEEKLAELVTELVDVEARSADLEERLKAIWNEVNQSTKHFEQRQRQLQGLISSVGQVDLSIEMCQVCPLTDEGRTAQATLAKADADLDQLVDTLADEAEKAQKLLVPLREDQSRIATKTTAVRTAIEELVETIAQMEADQTTYSRRIQEALTASRAREDRAKAATEAATAAAQLAECCERRDTMRQGIAAFDRQIGEIPIEQLAIDVGQATERLDVAKSTQSGWQRSIEDLRVQIGTLQGQLEATRDAEARLEETGQALGRVRLDTDDSGVLARSCDMIRTAQVTEACPQISEVATDLLSDFENGRFAIELRTQSERADGKGEKEDFLPVIIDQQTGEERIRLSGGETDIADEALRSAIGLYTAEISMTDGVEWGTAWRDETAGKLDPVTARHYVNMLRRLQEKAGFRQVIFVCHTEDVWRGADHRIFLDNGRATLG